MSKTDLILKALHNFSDEVSAKLNQLIAGEDEDQLRGPFENFMKAVGAVLEWEIVCVGETPLRDQLGRPDFAVMKNGLLVGYVELKAPGKGVVGSSFTGHNARQFKRFSALPNLLYSDGNSWALYRGGVAVRGPVEVGGVITSAGRSAVGAGVAPQFHALLHDFLTWDPIIPKDSDGNIDLKGFAALLAPLTGMLRDDVVDDLKKQDSPLFNLAEDWRQLLFPEATDSQFADAYAQTVTFALLLGRSEGADPLSRESAVRKLASKHSLLSRALLVLTDESSSERTLASLDMLTRVIGAVQICDLGSRQNGGEPSIGPWLYFYEDFLAQYDKKLRAEVGAYYTPIEVVRCQVRLVDEIISKQLGRHRGYTDDGVVTLDPATGTGTYLLGVIEHALRRVAVEQGSGAVAGQATRLAKNLFGFEWLVGPYAVTELRVGQTLQAHGAQLPPGGLQVYLTDTLENPNAQSDRFPEFMRPIAEQHLKAQKVKRDVPVIVCIGNPPYWRHDSADRVGFSRSGSWIRWGEDGEQKAAKLYDFVRPVVEAGRGVHLKNLYNYYIYFWRWALWKVFEQSGESKSGVVSFISASSYLDGDAFAGMREHMRKVCDEIWIIDLGGEGRGTRRSENVFNIQTPVAIAITVRRANSRSQEPARVWYSRLEGTRQDKFTALDGVSRLADIAWTECRPEWHAPFRPAGVGPYFDMPLLTDIMPWQHSGVQLKRTWPICPEKETLELRWRALLEGGSRNGALKETRDRTADTACPSPFDEEQLEPIQSLDKSSPCPPVSRYAYRSLDRQWVLFDPRLGDFLRPDLWKTLSSRQLYLSTLTCQPSGPGAPISATSCVPDLHHFRGSFGAKDILPLYRDSDASEPNITPGLLELLSSAYERPVTPEDLVAYMYGVLAHPGFTSRFHEELDSRELRVPLTRSSALFERVRATGAHLLWLHTYGERFVPTGQTTGAIPSGSTRCTKPVPEDKQNYPMDFEYIPATQTLRVGSGEFQPVSPEVFNFEVSGLKVVKSWLGYRMKNGKGRKSSPLDDIRPETWTSQFTTELLELLWVLEATVSGYPAQAQLLEEVLAGDCFSADELPAPPDWMRKPPSRRGAGELFERGED